jgi:hypothetical protein
MKDKFMRIIKKQDEKCIRNHKDYKAKSQKTSILLEKTLPCGGGHRQGPGTALRGRMHVLSLSFMLSSTTEIKKRHHIDLSG